MLATLPFKHIFINGISTGISKTISAPFETIKLLLQNQNALLQSGVISTPYNGFIDCLQRTIQTDGILALWNGNLIYSFQSIPIQILSYITRYTWHSLILKIENPSWFILTLNKFSGTFIILFSYPLEYARIKLTTNITNNKGEKKYQGIIDVLSKTIQSDGILGLYRGLFLQFSGIIIYRIAYFGLYDYMKPLLVRPGNSFILNFAIGYSITVFASLISYPIDTMRKRMMMSSNEELVFHSPFSCIKYIVKNEGILALYNGVGASILRGMIGAFGFVLFDTIKQHLS